MMKTTKVIILLLLCTGCDKEVKRQLLSTQTKQEKIECDKSDYCYNCGLTFGGKYECGFHFALDCPGKRDAIVRYDLYEITYEDSKGKQYKQQQQASTTEKYLSECD